MQNKITIASATRKRLYVTDKEVANILEISASTLSRILHGWERGGKRRRTSAYRNLDLIGTARPECVGGFRRWRISLLANALDVSEDDILKRIS